MLITMMVHFASAQTDERLRLDTAESTKQNVELEGVVTQSKKYSLDIEIDGAIRNVKVDNKTVFILDCASPRIDFDKSKLMVAERGEGRNFREYTFKKPLHIKATFAHRNQYQRFLSSEEKRIGNYEIANEPINTAESKKRVYLNGRIEAGVTNRKVVLKTSTEKYDVILAKNGRWKGFTLNELTGNNTGVRIVGIQNEGGAVTANTIFFWPIQQKKASN